MIKHGSFVLFCLLMLTGCWGGLVTGAQMIYDRHDIYVRLTDYQLTLDTRKVLYIDNALKCSDCYLDIAAFNGDVLISGHVPSFHLLDLVKKRLAWTDGYRHRYVYVSRGSEDNSLTDHWTTTKIRGQILGDGDIDPDRFKIITTDGMVYVMGDVFKEQARWVLGIVEDTIGLQHTVNLLHYYSFEKDVIRKEEK